MKKTILSKVAANAKPYLFNKKPSSIVPFNGDFPLVEDYKQGKWEEEFENTFWLEDCSEWFQETVAQYQRMEAIHNGFYDYLETIGKLNDFDNLKNSEKADLLMKFLDKSCMTLAYLNIKLNVGK